MGYILAPIIIGVINLAGVKTYGWIETVGGVLKLALVLGISLFLYIIAQWIPARSGGDVRNMSGQLDRSGSQE